MTPTSPPHPWKVRLPTPEGHSCGPLCGINHEARSPSPSPSPNPNPNPNPNQVPLQLRRQHLASRAAVGPWAARRRRRRLQAGVQGGVQGVQGVQGGVQGGARFECVGEGCMPQRGEFGEGPLANCTLFWAGAVRPACNPACNPMR